MQSSPRRPDPRRIPGPRQLVRALLGRDAPPSAGADDPRYPPIQDYAIIGDGLTAALVSRGGSVDWACFPRFDSPSVFGAILDADRGGAWRIAPTVDFTTERHYIDDTNVLSTTFITSVGRAEVVDFMPPPQIGPERLGDSAIVRIVRGLAGEVPMTLDFAPRFDYGRAEAEWTVSPDHGAQALNGEEAFTLSTDVPIRQVDGRVQADFTVTAGHEVHFVAAHRETPPLFWSHDAVAAAHRWREETEQYWRNWIARCTYDGPHAGHVRRSALALKLLDYAPTGGIVAAVTTSLPEYVGGTRNWDYRYCWLRDAGFILNAFYRLGYHEEGENFLGWILDCTAGDPAAIRVMYRIDGTDHLAEEVLDHFEGYRGSRPVRVGNGAATQFQLDAYGEILDVAWLLHERGGLLSERLCDFLSAVVNYVCETWQRPDAGIWEIRSEPRHFVYSKALAWVALDRGIRLAAAGACDPGPDLERWHAVRDAIADEVADKGYDAGRNTFLQRYGSPEVDASLLALPLRGLVAAGDPRMLGTIERVVADLGADHGLLQRYRYATVDDGVGGAEGAFLLCSFWLVHCYAETGRLEEATALFDELCDFANDVGLFSEQADPRTGDHLGNFPQGFTHVALINAALALTAAERAR